MKVWIAGRFPGLGYEVDTGILVDVTYDDGGSVSGPMFEAGCPESAGAAGNQDDFVFEVGMVDG